MSSLLIHHTGGRIETHFRVFGSLAFPAFYRDRRVIDVVSVMLPYLSQGKIVMRYSVSTVTQRQLLEVHCL